MKYNIIVIDFDQTIGYFDQLNTIYQYFELLYMEQKCPKQIIHDMQYIFRPQILDIIKTILRCRDENKIQKFYLYTKSKQKHTISRVIKFIKNQLKYKYKIFDDIIVSKNKQKSFNDIFFDVNNRKDSNICVIDDKKHEWLLRDNVFYIHCIPYYYLYDLESITYMLSRYITDFDVNQFNTYMHDFMEQRKTVKTLSINTHNEMSKKLKYFISIFVSKMC